MKPSHVQIFESLCNHVRETALLTSSNALLGWDERTGLPSAAGPYRADQMTYLSGLIHQRQTDPQLGEWLVSLANSELTGDPNSDSGATIRQLKRTFDRKTKLPQRLVEELTRTSILGQQAWSVARKENDFAAFQPILEQTIKLKREEAATIGYQDCAYDALLDDYEPHERTTDVTRVLNDLRERLVPLVAEISESNRKPNIDLLRRSYPIAAQQSFGRAAAEMIGFQFDRGRLDETDHPFCSGMGPDDCRILTRYDEHFFSSAFFGTLHEAGHGIYEQGLRRDFFGLPPGEYVSLGIHESQSRLWENLVGRSKSFWKWMFPQAQKAFPAALKDVQLDDFYFAINDVRPSLIRVEADEATYNLHIILRFELEQALIDDQLRVVDLPQAWQEKYQQYLGITPPNDADGVLQDIHWSAGLIGYFATYSLGNLYAAQFFQQADSEIGCLAESFAQGEFHVLGEWLRDKIHQQGQCYTPAELVEMITGRKLQCDALIQHLRDKVSPLYGLS